MIWWEAPTRRSGCPLENYFTTCSECNWEVLSSSPCLLNLMDIRAHEPSGGGNLSEGVGAGCGILHGCNQGSAFWDMPALVTWMRSESFPKASQWLSLRNLARGLPSFHLWWDHSLGVMSNPAAPSSSGLSMVASWSDEWHCHLVLGGGAGVSDTVGREAVEVHYPVCCSQVVEW